MTCIYVYIMHLFQQHVPRVLYLVSSEPVHSAALDHEPLHRDIDMRRYIIRGCGPTVYLTALNGPYHVQRMLPWSVVAWNSVNAMYLRPVRGSLGPVACSESRACKACMLLGKGFVACPRSYNTPLGEVTLLHLRWSDSNDSCGNTTVPAQDTEMVDASLSQRLPLERPS